MNEKVLIIDDEAIIREALTKVLKREGYEPKSAVDGNSGIAAFQKEDFDIIIVDLRLPDMSGMEVLDAAVRRAPKTCIIMMTAYGSTESVVEAIKNGAYDYLIKPFDEKKLFVTIQRGIERQKLLTENHHITEKLNDTTEELGRKIRQLDTLHKQYKDNSREIELVHLRLRDAEERMIQSEKLASVGTLANSMAHGLRNPFAVIKISLEALYEIIENKTPKIKKYRNSINRKLSEANKIVTDLLTYSHRKKPHLQLTKIEKLAVDSLSSIRERCKRHKIKIIKKFPFDTPKIFIDKEQMKQVFTNILINACDAMPNGGRLTIEVTSQIIMDKRGFRDLGGENYIEIAFSDTGCGISKENLVKLGEPFFSNKKKGLGLGLAVSFQIIQLHQGKIDVTSELSKGTTFKIKLPIQT